MNSQFSCRPLFLLVALLYALSGCDALQDIIDQEEPRIILGSTESEQVVGTTVTIQYTVNAPSGAISLTFNGASQDIGGSGPFFTRTVDYAIERNPALIGTSIPLLFEMTDASIPPKSASATYTIKVVPPTLPIITFDPVKVEVKRFVEKLIQFEANAQGTLSSITRVFAGETEPVAVGQYQPNFTTSSTTLLDTLTVPFDFPDGEYEVPYTITDFYGQEQTFVLTLDVLPAAPPKITLAQDYAEISAGNSELLMGFTVNAEAGIKSIVLNDTLSFDDFPTGVEFTSLYNQQFTGVEPCERFKFDFVLTDLQDRTDTATYIVQVIPCAISFTLERGSSVKAKAGEVVSIPFEAQSAAGIKTISLTFDEGEVQFDDFTEGDELYVGNYEFNVPAEAALGSSFDFEFLMTDLIEREERAAFQIVVDDQIPPQVVLVVTERPAKRGDSVLIGFDVFTDEGLDSVEVQYADGRIVEVLREADLSGNGLNNLYEYIVPTDTLGTIELHFYAIDKLSQRNEEPAIFRVLNVHDQPTVTSINGDSFTATNGETVSIPLALQSDSEVPISELVVFENGTELLTQDLSANGASSLSTDLNYLVSAAAGETVELSFQLTDSLGYASELTTVNISVE